VIAKSGVPGSREGGPPPDLARDPGTPPEPEASKARLLRSAELLGDAGLLHIDHDGEIYSLRRTRNGRLILTK